MRALIVEDQVLFAEAIRMALRDHDVDVVAIMESPDGVLEALEPAEARPDVVLMDIGLPGESGLALGARIVERYPDVRVVALTAPAHVRRDQQSSSVSRTNRRRCRGRSCRSLRHRSRPPCRHGTPRRG